MGSCQARLNAFLSASTAFAIWLIYDGVPLDHCLDRSVLVAIKFSEKGDVVLQPSEVLHVGS